MDISAKALCIYKGDKGGEEDVESEEMHLH
jgi:hypothetical protein